MTPRRNLQTKLVMNLAALILAAAAVAQDGKTAKAIEPEAVAAVERMSDYLKTLKTYRVQAETTTDEVLLAGPKIQYGGTIEARVRMPDRLRLTTTREDRDEQQFFYDGKTLTVWLKARTSWASTPVPPTIGEMIALVRTKYDLALPLDDLIRDAVRGELLKDVTAGIVIGEPLPRCHFLSPPGRRSRSQTHRLLGAPGP